jgi:lambda family phage portal protein
MNVLDRVIAAVNPVAGLKRDVARRTLQAVNTGYSQYGASHHKKSTIGWLSRGGSAKEDIIDNVQTLRERSRDLYMGVPLAVSAVNTYRTNIVGSGLRLKSQIDSDILNISEEEARNLESRIEREFSLWADTEVCDIERLDNFYELQQLAFLNWLLSGDVIVLLPSKRRVGCPYDLRIKLIEADRVCDPYDKMPTDRIQDGVETDKDGEVVAYHIRNTHPLSTSELEYPKWERVMAFGKRTGRRNILHIMNRWRIGQLRGVPFLAPVIETIKQLGRYTEAEITAAVINGMLTVFIQKQGITDEAPLGSVVPENEQVDRGDERSIELAPGAVIDLENGETANPVNPLRPNANFDGFVTAICQQIGAALGISHELLVMHFTASYSASRAALLEAWKTFRMYRSWLSTDFCQPIYEEWLAEAIAKGRIHAPGFFSNPLIQKAYSKAEWNGPAQGQLDPKKEAEAAEMRIQSGFSSRERESMEMNGSDFYRNIQQLRQEQKLMKEVFGGGGTIKRQETTDGDENNKSAGGDDYEDDSDDK